ncbi:S8 family serine peptidase [Leptospira sp. 2 VSF19]|uniref:S8 family serine peptidase n=1 Tax=Leptospira soteropolitanensis TaxID=2950025 RepID=A0AAW5VET2_9LEPT|nr:S8 family serine peptidase [Leptospira soteropolitanensis]MCW7491360.1 S8 family serine peptidase [Leptospira soteropolitanensis]MCW7498945.1 S8 family serine peptidase [Leptospira soteropolitanensis]MCW7521463.1 S8 family serine peptidase [Leptospira soteropolitanensis]MCW7525048.1 S8 family serine peptidase [Leptospira soteropolitanensis]MCW7528916.1 S8 family serine peptidase [Leptospira soteropolitanensis]
MNRLKTIISLLAIVSLSFGNCKPANKDEKISDLVLYYLLFLALANGAEENCTFSPSSSDPLYGDEWHLKNIGQFGGTVGEDANVSPLWDQDISGNRVIVSVVDDGLDIKHEDLAPNISVTARGLNLLNGTIYPTHSYSDSFHGSAVGGVIAARGGNSLGVRGAAPCSKLVGVNILEKSTIYTSDEYRAMVNESARVSISNNSWGSPDKYGWLWPSSSLWQQGVNEGITKGKSGKGTVYVWAAGNGANGGTIASPVLVDNANYDGQANYYGVMAIGGIGQNGKKAAYSESGANLWVVAHTQGNDASVDTAAISTTDATGANGLNVGGSFGDYSLGNYTKKFNGTSSATPLAAGAIALLIGKYPDLTWRDVRELVAYSARKNDASDIGWALNNAGLNINHKYGFGAVDAVSLLTKASTWTPITSGLITYTATALSPNTAIPDNDLTTGATVNYNVSAPISYIEYIDVEFTSNHTYFPELRIEITSPGGTKSVLSEPHGCINPYNNSLCASGNTSIASMTGSSTYRFGVARHLGESPNGTWVLKVFDASATDTGQINAVQLRIYGR